MKVRFLYDCEIHLNSRYLGSGPRFVGKDETFDCVSINFKDKALDIFTDMGTILDVPENLVYVEAE